MTLLGWSLGTPEMLALLFLALILFGARKLPELGRSLGRGIVEFKKGVKGLEDDVDNTDRKSDPPEPPRPPQRIGGATPKFDDRQPDKEGQPRSI
jgi:sec-independent protein translocase protein TatA